MLFPIKILSIFNQNSSFKKDKHKSKNEFLKKQINKKTSKFKDKF